MDFPLAWPLFSPPSGIVSQICLRQGAELENGFLKN